MVAHHSVPDGEARALWLARFAAFATMKGFDAHAARAAAAGIGDRLPMLTPAEDEALLAEAGFDGIETVYAGLTLRGWRALASPADP